MFTLVMLLIGMMMVAPFIFMLSASIKPTAEIFSDPMRLIPSKIQTSNYDTVFHHRFYFHWYWNSLFAVFALILLRGWIVSMAAFAFAKLQFRGRDSIFLVLLATMMIPGDMTIVSRYILYQKMHLIDTMWAIVLPAAFDVFFLFLLRQFFASLPNELMEAANIDGCSYFKIYWRILLPLAVPPIITMMLFTFIWTWNDYVSPYIFINDLKKQFISVGLQYFQGEAGPNYALQMAGATIAIVPIIIAFSLAQRYFVQGIANTGMK